MKNYLIILSLTFGSLQAQQARQDGFRIEGHINGLPEKSSVCLIDANKPTDTLSRGIVKGGVFILAGHVVEPNLFEINFFICQKRRQQFLLAMIS